MAVYKHSLDANPAQRAPAAGAGDALTSEADASSDFGEASTRGNAADLGAGVEEEYEYEAATSDFRVSPSDFKDPPPASR